MRENIPHYIGRYDVVSLLGEGGMARAYLAVSRGPAGFNKVAVIKQILPSLASDADFIAMFLDEARLAARLHHPNIVQTFDASEQDGSYVLAMESWTARRSRVFTDAFIPKTFRSRRTFGFSRKCWPACTMPTRCATTTVRRLAWFIGTSVRAM